MRQGVQDTIRGRVADLLAVRGDVTQAEFGQAIGRGGSWVSAFLAGKRHANDIRLVVRIARYFGVTVGYLLAETERGRDSSATLLLSAWEGMTDERDRKAVLNLALTLKPDADDLDTGPPHGPLPAPGGGGGTTKGPKRHR